MADIKILASERLTDNPDGGGKMTSTEIVDGVMNNLFPNISRIDRTMGSVELRKAFVKADSADTTLYNGLHTMISDGPDDPRVSVTMFSTNNWADERSDAQGAMERYLDVSVPTRMIPFDRQLAGQRTLIVFQRPELDLPTIGDVYVITSLPAETTFQFVRISDISHSVQTFTDLLTGTAIDFQARVITLTLTEPLNATYAGSQPTRLFTHDANTSQVRKTIVADATQYHGIHKPAVDASIGDLTVKLDSIYAQLVPASTQESALIGIALSGATSLVPSSLANLSIPLNISPLIAGDVIYLPTAIMPGSLTLATTAFGDVVDDGIGVLRIGGTTGPQWGTIDYPTGKLVYTESFSAGSMQANFMPAAIVSRASQTMQFPVTISTRGYVFPFTLNPLPTPGTLSVAYRALGKWYTLTDDGTGALTGEIGVGAGSVDFSSGNGSVSLGALPDIGSSVILSWGTASDFEVRTGDVAIESPIVNGTLAHAVSAGTASVTWMANSVTKTATDNGSGQFTGDASGTLDYKTGDFRLKPTLLPDQTTAFSFTYDDQTANSTITENFTTSASGGLIGVTIVGHPVRPGSVSVEYHLVKDALNQNNIVLLDNGNGGFVDIYKHALVPGAAINYTTGAITGLPASVDFYGPGANYQPVIENIPARTVDPTSGYYSATATPLQLNLGYATETSTFTFVNGQTVQVQYRAAGGSVTTHMESFASPPLKVDLTPLVSSAVISGGVMFVLGGRTYVDRAGTLYYDINPRTNAGTAGGTMDYITGVSTITAWAANQSSALTLKTLLTQPRALPISFANGHAPGSPLRPASFYIQANQIDGTLISGTADSNGNIATSAMHGYVDVTTGVYSIGFGAYVLDSTLSSADKAQPWYSASNVDGSGHIWRPAEVKPETVKFNCVVQTSLALSSTILGIDPVRLPLDGRVQAVRPGDMIILHDTQVTSLSNPQSAGQVTTLPRGDLATVVLRDQTGAIVPGQISGGATVSGAKYTADLTAGTITMASPLDLSAFMQPLVATHRIEDSCLVTDVQITGHVSIAQPLTHGYTAANSRASTALIAPFVGGNVQATYSHLFSQQTWNSAAPNWTDAIIGSPTTAAYNDLTYPITVTNRDAITEKWALVFTSSTTFQIVAQDLGVIGTGTISANVAPINLGTGQPYFTLDYHGFGSGWATGNAIRFDTNGAGNPIWFARTIKSGPSTTTNDSFTVEPRWDKS